MTFAQQLCHRRRCLGLRRRDLAQIDCLSRPARPHRWERSHDARIGINPAQRIGVPALRAARVEQEIVKVPEQEVVVALGCSQPTVASRLDLEQDLAIHQQGEKLDPRKTVQPTELLDLSRCR
jgi:hypothetical protein